MAKISSYLDMLKYLPTVIGVVKQVRGQNKDDDSAEFLRETQQSVADLRKDVIQRLEEMTTENARLRTRLRDLDASVTVLKVLVYTSFGIGIVGLILALIALIRLAGGG